jgi:hypothetical protein
LEPLNRVFILPPASSYKNAEYAQGAPQFSMPSTIWLSRWTL